jgi:hypothetical protein
MALKNSFGKKTLKIIVPKKKKSKIFKISIDIKIQLKKSAFRI